MSRVVLVIILVACGSSDQAPAHAPPAKPAAAPPPRSIDQSVVHVARLHANGDLDDVVLPEGPDRSGEQVRDLWIAPDGTEFVTGYMYTGKPGPDTGAVYRRRPNESAFEIIHMIREHELGHIAGVSATDFYVGGAKVLQHFDGSTWTDLALPPAVKDVSALALHDGELWLASFDRETLSHRKLGAATWTVEKVAPAPYEVIGFAGAEIYAGAVGQLEHRAPDGTWRLDVTTPHLGIDAIYAASPTDVFIAGGDDTLLHYDGNAWTSIVASGKPYTLTLWGRSPTEIYASTSDSVVVWRGAQRGFSATKLHPGRLLGGTATEVVSAYEVDHAHAR